MYYVIYLRKSRADLEKERYGEFETLAVHEAELKELAKRDGYKVAQVYKELVSGETIAARPEFQKVMERVQDKDCEGIIVHAIDRLGRGDPVEYGWILSTLKWSNTKIVTPGRVYDPNNQDDFQQLKMYMFVSNIEFDHIRERLHSGSAAAVKRGEYIGPRPPYGYSKAIINRAHTLVPNEQADTVKLMYKLACEGYNKGAIARYLNNAGIPTYYGKLWTAARITAILSNPIYKGYVRYGRYAVKNVPNGNGFTKTRALSDDYIIALGLHEPIVDVETWEKANKLAFEGTPVAIDRSIKNPLAGLIVCGNCGRALIRQDVVNKQGKHYPRLHHAYYTECQCKSISLQAIMEALKDTLVQVVEDYDIEVSEKEPSVEERRMLESALKNEEKKLDKLVELFYADALTVDEFKERRNASQENAATIKARLSEIDSDVQSNETLVIRTRETIATLDDPNVDAEAKNTLLKGLLKRVEYIERDRKRKNRRFDLKLVFR